MKKRWKQLSASFFYQYISAIIIIPIPLFEFVQYSLYDYPI